MGPHDHPNELLTPGEKDLQAERAPVPSAERIVSAHVRQSRCTLSHAMAEPWRLLMVPELSKQPQQRGAQRL